MFIVYDLQGNHCVGVYYSSLIPGRTKLKEFVAGTVKPHPKGNLNAWNAALHEDAAGKQMILMIEFFRTPMDYHQLLVDTDEDFDDHKPASGNS